jgi:hypothetical protein
MTDFTEWGAKSDWPSKTYEKSSTQARPGSKFAAKRPSNSSIQNDPSRIYQTNKKSSNYQRTSPRNTSYRNVRDRSRSRSYDRYKPREERSSYCSFCKERGHKTDDCDQMLQARDNFRSKGKSSDPSGIKN